MGVILTTPIPETPPQHSPDSGEFQIRRIANHGAPAKGRTPLQKKTEKMGIFPEGGGVGGGGGWWRVTQFPLQFLPKKNTLNMAKWEQF